MNWEKKYEEKLVSFKEAAEVVKSGDRVWLSGVTDTPFQIIDALIKRYKELENVEIIGGILMKPFEFLKPQFKGHLNYKTIFLGPVERMFVKHGNVEICSFHFSNFPDTVNNVIKPNVMLLTTPPPNKDGYLNYSLIGSMCNDFIVDGLDTIIVQINKNMPAIIGDRNLIHISEVDYICEGDYDVPVLPNPPVDEDDKKIASYIEPLINDGDTLQIGIGGIGNAVAYSLDKKKDLGIHTEMLVDSLVYLAKKGVVTGKRKNVNKGKITFGFAAGGKELHEFVNNNPLCQIAPLDYINDPVVIGSNDNMISINAALSVDLTGQVCSESVGFTQISSTGGQLDFVRGAHMSKNGKSFIALKATTNTKKGLVSNIVLSLAPGSVVTTPRADVQYIVTEYGIANLKNKSIPQRVAEMIEIAHPDFRDQLREDAKKVGLTY